MGTDEYTCFTPSHSLWFYTPRKPCCTEAGCRQWFEARTQEAVPRGGSVAGLGVQEQPRAVPRETSVTRAEGLLPSHPSASPLNIGALAEARITEHPCTLQATACCWPPSQAGSASTPQHGHGAEPPPHCSGGHGRCRVVYGSPAPFVVQKWPFTSGCSSSWI